MYFIYYYYYFILLSFYYFLLLYITILLYIIIYYMLYYYCHHLYYYILLLYIVIITILLLLRKYSRQQVSIVHSMVVTTRISKTVTRWSWLKGLTGSRSNAPVHGEKLRVSTALVGEFKKVTIRFKVKCIHTVWALPIHRLSAVHSTLGVRWSHFILNPFGILVLLPYYKSLVLG